MHVVILCDSKFGNTKQIALAMQSELGPEHAVELRQPEDGLLDVVPIDLLLVGGPTHAHGASQPLKAALKALPTDSLRGTRVATFDTRFRINRLLSGSAAVTAGKMLKHVGATEVAPAESFFVTRDNPPVLEAGELERAATWARTVVS